MERVARFSLYPHQGEYVTSKHPHPALVGGYGSGKTYSNIHRTLNLLERRNKEKVKPFIFYAAPTYDIINTTYYPDLIEMLELLEIEYTENKALKQIIVTQKKLAGKIKLVSLDNFKYLVGFNATDGILDEFDVIPHSRQEATWTRSLARLRGCDNATLSISTTPEGYKYVYQLAAEGKIHQITAATSDNKHLPNSYIQDLLNNYDEQHIEMYFKGRYVNLTGLRALYNYKRDALIEPIPYSELPNTLTVGMDFNVDPFCATMSCFMGSQKITFDEFYVRNTGGASGYESYTDKTANMILSKYPNNYYNKHVLNGTAKRTFDIVIRPDMTGGARKTAAGLTDINILKKYNLTIEGSRNPIVSERLKVSNIALSKGSWMITKNCKELVKDCEFVVTDKYGEIQDDDKLRGHLLDAVTYDVFRDFHKVYNRPANIVSSRGM